MEHGELLKKIRLSKGYTLKEAAQGVVSLSQLSRFEQGKSSMRVNDFHKVLKNLNTNQSEFYYLFEEQEGVRLYRILNDILLQKTILINCINTKKP